MSPMWPVLAGIDFFTFEVLTWRGLVTYYVLFFIHRESRRVSLAGITGQILLPCRMNIFALRYCFHCECQPAPAGIQPSQRYDVESIH